MRLGPNQIKKLVQFISEELEKDGFIQSKDEATVKSIIEAIIIKDLKMEDDIEKEAEKLIKIHTANIHAESLDFDMLVRRAKSELAKKKGFKL